MSGARLRAVVCVLGLVVGCDGLGRAVIGEHGGPAVEPLCESPLPCEPIVPSEPFEVPRAPEPVDLTMCAQAGDALCVTAATTPSMQTQAQCAAPEPATLRTFEEAPGLQQQRCATLRLVHAAGVEPPRLARIELAVWNQVNMLVESDVPATLELTGGSVQHVSLSLRGPITLRIVDSEDVADLRVSASDGGARIELVRTRARAVSIAAPQAEVLLRRSALERVAITARRIEIESSDISDAAWQAASLQAADATLSRVRSTVERSVLSACDVEMTSFSGCQSWTAIQGVFSDVQLFSCAEEAGVYGSAMVRAQLEGDLILDGAGLVDAVLGLGEVGAITTWDTQLTNPSFCTDQHSLTFGGSSGARCAHCDLTPEPAQPDACRLESADPRIVKSESCPMFESRPMQVCRDPQPERMRPPRK